MSEKTSREDLVYINGKLKTKSEAKISVWDHGLLYGDGVFEAMRVYDWNIFMLKEHIDRLYNSARAIKIEIPISKEDMINAVTIIVKKNNLHYGYIRIIVTRGEGPMGVDPRNCKEPTIIIMSEAREPLFEGKPVSAIISSFRRVPSESLDPRIKSLNYLNNVLAKIQAIESNAEEAIMLNIQGYVTEGVTENIFVARENMLYTPPLSSGILEGITRKVVMIIADKLGIQVKETNLTVYDLYVADEIFLTGTAAEITPVTKIDGRTVGNGKPGPIYLKIVEEFRKMTKDPKYGIKVG